MQLKQRYSAMSLYGFAIVILIILTAAQAQWKTADAVDWFDFGSELSLLLLSAGWYLIVTLARPKGKATQLLLTGLLAFSCGCLLDVLDELFITEPVGLWYALVEKGATPLGLMSLTWGLAIWRKEQQMVNHQLQTREQFLRDHQLIDMTTALNDARALERQLAERMGSQFSLLMFDLIDLQHLNDNQGWSEGDRRLTLVAQLLAEQVRSCDMVCRYAGDQFVVLMPYCQPKLAASWGAHLQQQLAQLGVATRFEQLNHQGRRHSPQILLQQLNQQLQQQKLSEQAA